MMRLAKLFGWAADQLDRLTGPRSDSDWPRNPRTHIYTSARRCLGHDYKITAIERGGHVLRVTGWGPMVGAKIERGDYLVMSRDGGNVVAEMPTTTRYRVAEIEYEFDPDDMWNAQLWWHGLPEVQTDWPKNERWEIAI